MTRVVVPYIHIHPRTDEALHQHAPQAERVDVSGSPGAYWKLLRDLWAACEDFTIIEHDVVIHEHTLAAFESCPKPWCGCGDPAVNPPGYSRFHNLQCVRFRAELMVELPGVFDVPHEWRFWSKQDGVVLLQLHRAGHELCVHSHTPTMHRHNVRDANTLRAAQLDWRLQGRAERPSGGALERAAYLSACYAGNVPRPAEPTGGLLGAF